MPSPSSHLSTVRDRAPSRGAPDDGLATRPRFDLLLFDDSPRANIARSHQIRHRRRVFRVFSPIFPKITANSGIYALPSGP